MSSQIQNTGMTQGADFGNTFTPAANTISLRGLGHNHTLSLGNGRRIADYPVAYDGPVNFVNLANIPSTRFHVVDLIRGQHSDARLFAQECRQKPLYRSRRVLRQR